MEDYLVQHLSAVMSNLKSSLDIHKTFHLMLSIKDILVQKPVQERFPGSRQKYFLFQSKPIFWRLERGERYAVQKKSSQPFACRECYLDCTWDTTIMV